MSGRGGLWIAGRDFGRHRRDRPKTYPAQQDLQVQAGFRLDGVTLGNEDLENSRRTTPERQLGYQAVVRISKAWPPVGWHCALRRPIWQRTSAPSASQNWRTINASATSLSELSREHRRPARAARSFQESLPQYPRSARVTPGLERRNSTVACLAPVYRNTSCGGIRTTPHWSPAAAFRLPCRSCTPCRQ